MNKRLVTQLALLLLKYRIVFIHSHFFTVVMAFVFVLSLGTSTSPPVNFYRCSMGCVCVV